MPDASTPLVVCRQFWFRSDLSPFHRVIAPVDSPRRKRGSVEEGRTFKRWNLWKVTGTPPSIGVSGGLTDARALVREGCKNLRPLHTHSGVCCTCLMPIAALWHGDSEDILAGMPVSCPATSRAVS